MKKLMIEMLIIVTFVSAFGFWALGEWRKRYPNFLNGYISEFCIPKNTKYKTNFNSSSVKVYQGKWHKTYLEVIK